MIGRIEKKVKKMNKKKQEERLMNDYRKNSQHYSKFPFQ